MVLKFLAVGGDKGSMLAESCLVPFCRGRCPVLPKDAEVLRASGKCICEICRCTFDVHPKYAYPTGMKHVVRACDGTFLHL